MEKPMKRLPVILCGAFTIALWSGVNSQSAKAAEEKTSIEPYEITMDYQNQKLILNESGRRKDMEIFCEYGIRKTVTTGKGSNRYTRDVCSIYDTDIFDYTDGLVIDLSTLKREKDCYIRLSGDCSTDPITIKIPAVNTAVKAQFNAVDGIVELYDVTDKEDPTILTTEQIEYRTAYSSWKEYYRDDLSVYQHRGAVLYFRLRAKAAERLNLTAPEPVTGDIESMDGYDIPVYETWPFSGKEIKVTVAKFPLAPKVTVNYSRQTFLLPKNTEYRMLTNRGMAWKAAKKNTSLLLDLRDLTEEYGESEKATFEVRLAETVTKPSSAINRISFTAPEKPVVYSMVNNQTGAVVSGQNMVRNYLRDEFDCEGLIAEYVYNAKAKKYTGVRFINTMEDAYEIYAARTGEVPSQSSTAYQTIKACPEGKQDAVTTISSTKLREGSKVYIRKKGNAGQKQFSSSCAIFGVVGYPDEAPED